MLRIIKIIYKKAYVTFLPSRKNVLVDSSKKIDIKLPQNSITFATDNIKHIACGLISVTVVIMDYYNGTVEML